MSFIKAVLFPVLIISLFACNPSVVSLKDSNAKGEVALLQNFLFEFDRDLAADSLLGTWTSTAYISFEPEIAGRFRWQENNMLVFSPSAPLAPATSYKAVLNKELLKGTEYRKLGKESISFHTAALRLENSNITWIAGENNAPLAQLEINFNYTVDPKKISDQLQIVLEGKQLPFSTISLDPGSSISFRLPELVGGDEDMQAEIILAKGALPEGGRNGSEQETRLPAFIPSPFHLRINDIIANHDGSGGFIQVKTSQQLQAENLTTAIQIIPAVKFSVEPTDDGFNLSSSAFNSTEAYTIKLNKGLRGKIGGVLREDYDHQFTFGELYPALNFDNPKAVYLSSSGSRQIGVNIVNIPKVKVVVSRIYESNILAAMHYGYYPREKGNDNYYYDDGESYTAGDIIYEKEIETRLLPGSGKNRIFRFDMEDQLPALRGIYHIHIRSTEDYWISDSRLISRTDLGIITKEGFDNLMVFVNSVQNAKSVGEAQVIAYGNNNQVLGTGSTDASGAAEIKLNRSEFAGFKPALLIVKTADDFNFLPFRSTRVNTSRFETGGKRANPAGLETFIYAERDIYRPGEKVNFSLILRDRNWQNPGQIPIKMKFLYPDGKEMLQLRKTLNEQGSAEASIDISGHAITGSYILEVYSSTDVLLGTQSFHIEEFVPDRIRVETKLDKQLLKPGDKLNLTIQARNFFGPPAANRNYEAEVQIRPVSFRAKDYPAYTFALFNEGFTFDKVFREGKTSSAGTAVENFEIPSMFRNSGLLESLFYATVFDETGRPVSRRLSAEIYSQDYFLGIRDQGYNYFPLSQEIRFPLIAVNKDGKAVSGKAQVRIIKKEYRTVLAKSGSYFRYESQRDDKILAEQTLDISGESKSFSFTPRSPGNYELRVSIPGAAAYIKQDFYSYGHWGGDQNSFEVNTEGQIDISTDKSSYQPGDKIKILFKAPFNGRMLVTLETDKVLSHQYIELSNRSASLDLDIKENHLPNVFITATLIKPHQLSDIPLTVAYGFQGVKVEESDRHNKVIIQSAEKSRSKSKQEVIVKAEPGSFVTLAAVDNGVLQISDFKTPDPYNFFYAPRALAVEAYSIYPLLFPEIRSSTGGDLDAQMQKRVNPMPSKRVKIASYWSGIQKAGARGEAKFSIDIPEFSGEIRLMAVAYKGNQFGSAEKNMTVADPVVISPALPRFLSPGDSLDFPVILTNTTNTAAKVSITAEADGAAAIHGQKQKEVDLAPNAEGRVYFPLRAANALGLSTIKIQVRGGGEKYTSQTELSIRPASPLQKRTGSGIISGGSKQNLELPSRDFLPATVSYKLVIGRSLALDLGNQLQYLLRYPYGCTEQVISAAFPQLYFSDLTGTMGSGTPAGNIGEALRQMRLRQLHNGGLMQWDGSGSANWWITVYAAHFALEAGRAGYDVPESLTNSLLAYIGSRLKSRETVNYYYNRDQQKKIAPKEVAYGLYVLALAGRPDISSMNYYKARPEMLSLDSRYLLSAAYAIAGDRKRFAELLPPAFQGEESVPQTGGSFYSPIRDEAIALSALLEVDPGNAQIPLMARHVSGQLKNRRWFSTQEAAFGFISLGKIASRAAKSTATADILVNGKKLATVDQKTISLNEKTLQSSKIEIQASGSGQLYYFWELEGISATGNFVEEDSYLRVRRKFFDRNGLAITDNNFRQNDLIIVQLSLEKQYDGAIDNIVITDILPAGFEIENPRTKEIPGMNWIKDGRTPLALDVRDDRIHFFDDLRNNKQVYYYAVRAVSPGSFRMGPASADAMYQGEYHSYHGAGKILIRE